ncbi:MAG: PAS domain S-box protein, partial [Pseudomonadota bacterium]
MPHRYLGSALPQNEELGLFRLMVEDIRECAIFLLDPNGIITVWNKGAEEMKGYSAKEAIGQPISMLYTDEDQARGWPEHNLAKAAEHNFFREENWRKRKDGRLFWAHIALTALRSGDKLLGFSKVTLDLTSHKLLESCVKEKEEIDRILMAADSGTWQWNIESNQVTVLPHFYKLLGYDRNEATISFDEWLSLIHPADQQATREQLIKVRDRVPQSQFESQIRFSHRNGDCHWFYVRADWLRQPDQAAIILMGVAVNIHSLKTAEEDREQLFQQLQQERTRFSNILEQMPSGVILAEAPTGKITYQNRLADEMMGPVQGPVNSVSDYERYRVTNAAGRRIKVDELPLARSLANLEIARSEELLYQRPDRDAVLHYSVTSAPIFDADGVARIAVAVLHDISTLKEAQLSIAREKERAQVTLAAITDGVITTDLSGMVTSINMAAENLTGWRNGQALGRSIGDVVHFQENGPKQMPILDMVNQCLQQQRVIYAHQQEVLINKMGNRHSIENAAAPILLDKDGIVGTVLVFHDVTDSQRLMRRLSFEASHDALTGLVNRREFESKLRRTLEHSHAENGSNAALLYMDLDQFKIVNDTCGHSAGDDLLKQLAQVYRVHVRERDTLARIGGDEFALIVEHCSVTEAIIVAQKILDATRNFQYACKGRLFQLGVSIGLIPIDEGISSVEHALRQADHACYIAKENGRNRVYIHKNN